MTTDESVQHTDEDLSTWDWRGELRRQERSIPWLARRTGRADNTVYRYGSGRETAPTDWLALAWDILHGEGVA